MITSTGAVVELGKINDRWELWMTPDRVEFHAKRPGWEAPRMAHMAETLRPDMCVWDIGAESGDFTALYHLLVGRNGCVIPVEPSPPYWASIRAHWEANNLPPVPYWFMGFLSPDDVDHPPLDDGFEPLRRTGPDGWPTASRGPVIPDFGFRHLAEQADCTHALCLDSMLERFATPDVIVTDIEGAEGIVFERGCTTMLADVQPLLYVSVHPPTMAEWYDRTVDQLLATMHGWGYSGIKLGEGTEEYWFFYPEAT